MKFYLSTINILQVFDATALIAEDAGSELPDAAKYSPSTSIFPSRYRIDLLPIVDDDGILRVHGRVVINFHYNDTSSLSKIILNAKGMNITKIKMLSSAIDRDNQDRNDTDNMSSTISSTNDTNGKYV